MRQNTRAKPEPVRSKSHLQQFHAVAGRQSTGEGYLGILSDIAAGRNRYDDAETPDYSLRTFQQPLKKAMRLVFPVPYSQRPSEIHKPSRRWLS